MSATHAFSESNGAEVVHDSIANLNFGSVDDHELNTTTYPITRGNASFEKYLRCKFSDIFTEISNMLLWQSSGSYVAGESRTAAANVVYAQPSATPNADSDVPTTEGTALAIQAADGSATIIAPGYTKYIRTQLKTTGSTPSGSVPQLTTCFQYDEV